MPSGPGAESSLTSEIASSISSVDRTSSLSSDAEEKVFYVKGFELFLLSLDRTSGGKTRRGGHFSTLISTAGEEYKQ